MNVMLNIITLQTDSGSFWVVVSYIWTMLNNNIYPYIYQVEQQYVP